jgi:hypothetical protein
MVMTAWAAKPGRLQPSKEEATVFFQNVHNLLPNYSIYLNARKGFFP